MQNERRGNWALRTLSMHRPTYSGSENPHVPSTSSNHVEYFIIWPTHFSDGEPCCLVCGPEVLWRWASTAKLHAGTSSKRGNISPLAAMKVHPTTFVGSAKICPQRTLALNCSG